MSGECGVISNPERALWQMVLFQAVRDARLTPDLWPVPPRDQNDCIAARAYLTRPSEDLAMVCAMAGVDMVALIDRIRAQIAKAPPSEALVPVPRRRGRVAKRQKSEWPLERHFGRGPRADD